MNISSNDENIVKIISEEKEVIKGLAKVSEISFKQKNDKELENWLSNVINEKIDIQLDIKDKIDLDKELGRLNKNLSEKEKYILNLKKKIENKDYKTRVNENVQKEDREKLEKAEIEMQKIKDNIANLNKLKK